MTAVHTAATTNGTRITHLRPQRMRMMSSGVYFRPGSTLLSHQWQPRGQPDPRGIAIDRPWDARRDNHAGAHVVVVVDELAEDGPGPGQGVPQPGRRGIRPHVVLPRRR